MGQVQYIRERLNQLHNDKTSLEEKLDFLQKKNKELEDKIVEIGFLDS